MGQNELENLNPTIYEKIKEREVTLADEDNDVHDEFDAREVFGIL